MVVGTRISELTLNMIPDGIAVGHVIATIAYSYHLPLGWSRVLRAEPNNIKITGSKWA